MGGTTADGWPYVTPDDHPKEFPAHSQGLANGLQYLGDTVQAIPAIAGGQVSVPVLAAGATSAAFNIVFPAGKFTVAPKVLVSSGSTRLVGAVTAPTATGCTLNWSNFTAAATAGAVPGYWVAIGA
jgi:hypothetical protein